VHGVENAIRSAIATSTVRRIVLTSSVVAATPTVGPMTEETWTVDQGEATQPYSRSKTLAEKRAWALIKEYEASEAFKTHPISLVTVLPSLTFGAPIFAEKARSSAAFVAGIVDGSAKAQGGLLHVIAAGVDVRDVAKVSIRVSVRVCVRVAIAHWFATLLSLSCFHARFYRHTSMLPRTRTSRAA
jgi:nucleoside-diphosphate-sugar epimerase